MHESPPAILPLGLSYPISSSPSPEKTRILMRAERRLSKFCPLLKGSVWGPPSPVVQYRSCDVACPSIIEHRFVRHVRQGRRARDLNGSSISEVNHSRPITPQIPIVISESSLRLSSPPLGLVPPTPQNMNRSDRSSSTVVRLGQKLGATPNAAPVASASPLWNLTSIQRTPSPPSSDFGSLHFQGLNVR